MMTLSSIIDPLRASNRLSRDTLFEWQLVSFDGQPIRLTCGIEIAVDCSLEQASQHISNTQLFVIVAAFNHQTHTPSIQLSLLRKMSAQSQTVFALESGVWLLARAGVVRNHNVTVHWEDLENLAYAYPQLKVAAQRYVVDQKIWTSGGASPSLDMFLHFLRSIGRDSLALDVASAFIYNGDQHSSLAQTTVSLGRIETIEPRLAKAIHIMENAIEEPVNVSEIARRVGVSVRSLELMSRLHLKASPGTYYQRLRLQAARRLTLDTNDSILDISVKTGFSSQASLSRAFTKRYGQSPMQLRQQHRQSL